MYSDSESIEVRIPVVTYVIVTSYLQQNYYSKSTSYALCSDYNFVVSLHGFHMHPTATMHIVYVYVAPLPTAAED